MVYRLAQQSIEVSLVLVKDILGETTNKKTRYWGYLSQVHTPNLFYSSYRTLRFFLPFLVMLLSITHASLMGCNIFSG